MVWRNTLYRLVYNFRRKLLEILISNFDTRSISASSTTLLLIKKLKDEIQKFCSGTKISQFKICNIVLVLVHHATGPCQSPRRFCRRCRLDRECNVREWSGRLAPRRPSCSGQILINIIDLPTGTWCECSFLLTVHAPLIQATRLNTHLCFSGIGQIIARKFDETRVKISSWHYL
jgi:hypothetical protein